MDEWMEIMMQRHVHCINSMSRHFGFKNSPSPIRIEREEYSSGGGFVLVTEDEEPKIMVGDGLGRVGRHGIKGSLDTCTHETIHYLHITGNPELREEMERLESGKELRYPGGLEETLKEALIKRYIEYVADLGTMQFYVQEFGQGDEEMLHYIGRNVDTYGGYFRLLRHDPYPNPLEVYVPLKTIPGLLRIIAQAPLEKGIVMVEKLKKEYGASSPLPTSSFQFP